MKLQLELPISVRATIKGARGEKYIFCKTTVTADIPEVSLAEMPIVFSVGYRAPPRTYGDIPEDMTRRWDYKELELEAPYRLRAFEGVPYRRLAGSMDECEELGLFRDPFDVECRGRYQHPYVSADWLPDYGGDISPYHVSRGNGPLSRPLVDEMEWHMDKESVKTQSMKSAWPAGGPRDLAANSGWHAHRNQIRFEDLHDLIEGIRGEDLELSRRMHEVQTAKLLVAGGEIWMRTRPPAYRVEYEPSQNGSGRDNIKFSMVTAPESYVGNLNVQHFSLADAEMAYLAALNLYEEDRDAAAGRLPRRKLFGSLVNYECDDPALLDYDHLQEEVNRFGYAAAMECRSYLRRNPDAPVSDDERGTVERAFAEMKAVNHILGIHRDMRNEVHALADVWRRLGNKQFFTAGNAPGREAESAGRRAVERAAMLPFSALDDAFATMGGLEF